VEIPTLFDWLEASAFLRGFPAVLVILVTAILITLFVDWRLALFALMVQYLAAGLLFVDVLDPRLAILKVLAGLFICLIIYWTARQIDDARNPAFPAITETRQIETNRISGWLRQRAGIFEKSRVLDAFVRALFTVGVLALVFLVVRWRGFVLPGVPGEFPHLQPAILLLVTCGLVGMAANRLPLAIGMALFTFLTGFELYYASLNQTVASLLALAGLNFACALCVAYLAQAGQPRVGRARRRSAPAAAQDD
jgi:hypothetical protein